MKKMMKQLKKAELSINMIVIVAISIIVLVILIYLVSNQGRQTEKSTSCPSRGGVCVAADMCDYGGVLSTNKPVCEGYDRVCCNLMSVKTGP